MKWGVKETSRTSTAGSNGSMIELPQEIKDAVLQGYDVYITRSVRDGVVSAKISFHKVRVVGSERLNTEKP